MRSFVVSFAGAFVLNRGVDAVATTTQACAAMMPTQDVQRGKSAFFSDCDKIEGAPPTGCWTPGQYTTGSAFPVEIAAQGYGCQTCVMTNSKFKNAVFPVFWAATLRDQLAACPEDEFDYAAFHASVDPVLASSIVDSSECDDGWFHNDATNRCYSKSTRYTLAQNWDVANQLCQKEQAALVTLESEAENEWFISNLLWPGFMGETFTSLVRTDPGTAGTFQWVKSSFVAIANFTSKSFSDWYPGMGSDPLYPTPDNAADRRSCMEIYPQLPKKWNPFSCDVNKQYVCIRDGATTRGDPLPTPAPTPAPSSIRHGGGGGSSSSSSSQKPSAPSPSSAGLADDDVSKNNVDNGNSGSSGMSTGQTAGLAVGVLVGAGLLAGGAAFAVRRHRRTAAAKGVSGAAAAPVV